MASLTEMIQCTWYCYYIGQSLITHVIDNYVIIIPTRNIDYAVGQSAIHYTINRNT
jgi:hypothetical protein